MNRLDAAFAALKAKGRRAFIPFLTAGDPGLEATPGLASALIDAGADVLEIGFPYSDPIADGPVIQASYTRALAKKLTLDGVFAAAKAIRARHPDTPLVGMMSYSLVYRRTPGSFLDRAAAAGFSGLIVPDLPLEESLALKGEAESRGLKLVQLVTPTTPPERAERIVAASGGFVYCVSVTGITGERAEIPAALAERLAWLRSKTSLPLCVGFGVSTPDQVRRLREHADGVIVGSALVRLLEPAEGAEARVSALARSLAAALD
ncbi:MAG: tryptophan synthase subunit alpha [Gemmataceae bacterium]